MEQTLHPASPQEDSKIMTQYTDKKRKRNDNFDNNEEQQYPEGQQEGKLRFEKNKVDHEQEQKASHFLDKEGDSEECNSHVMMNQEEGDFPLQEECESREYSSEYVQSLSQCKNNGRNILQQQQQQQQQGEEEDHLCHEESLASIHDGQGHPSQYRPQSMSLNNSTNQSISTGVLITPVTQPNQQNQRQYEPSNSRRGTLFTHENNQPLQYRPESMNITSKQHQQGTQHNHTTEQSVSLVSLNAPTTYSRSQQKQRQYKPSNSQRGAPLTHEQSRPLQYRPQNMNMVPKQHEEIGSHTKTTKQRLSTVNSFKKPQIKKACGTTGKETMPLPSFPCLLTHQKTKKKKSWKDGELRINYAQSRVSIYKVDENNSTVQIFMESKYCSPDEMERIKNKEAEYIEFEQHLVEIDYTGDSNTIPQSTSNCNINKPVTHNNSQSIAPKRLNYVGFKVPSSVIRPTECVEQSEISKENVSVAKNVVVGSRVGHYAITSDELDDIWDSTHSLEDNDKQYESLENDQAECYTSGHPLESVEETTVADRIDDEDSTSFSFSCHPSEHVEEAIVASINGTSYDTADDDNTAGNLWGSPVWIPSSSNEKSHVVKGAKCVNPNVFSF